MRAVRGLAAQDPCLMSKRHVTFWIFLIIGWLAVLPFSALAAEFQQRAALSEEAAQRYLVVVNAGNRASGTPEEIRQLVRAIGRSVAAVRGDGTSSFSKHDFSIPPSSPLMNSM